MLQASRYSFETVSWATSDEYAASLKANGRGTTSQKSGCFKRGSEKL
jgi:hypothetical protein